MASTQGLSTRLHAMEARLDCMTDTIEQFRSRIHHMELSIDKSMAINHVMLDMMYKLQPLANYLSPLKNSSNPRASSTEDSGLGDMESSIITEECEIADTCSESARPAPLRRRRARSNLKRIQDTISSSKAVEAEAEEMAQVDHRSEIITICMMQDVAQRT